MAPNHRFNKTRYGTLLFSCVVSFCTTAVQQLICHPAKFANFAFNLKFTCNGCLPPTNARIVLHRVKKDRVYLILSSVSKITMNLKTTGRLMYVRLFNLIIKLSKSVNIHIQDVRKLTQNAKIVIFMTIKIKF